MHIFVLRMFYDDVCNRSTTLLSINDTCAYLTIVFQYESDPRTYLFLIVHQLVNCVSKEDSY